ncbi:unnamed protein product [Closterium sp. NIES-65]|nr:unnamed protein product [Closterium sp. NIES-65]
MPGELATPRVRQATKAALGGVRTSALLTSAVAGTENVREGTKTPTALACSVPLTKLLKGQCHTTPLLLLALTTTGATPRCRVATRSTTAASAAAASAASAASSASASSTTSAASAPSATSTAFAASTAAAAAATPGTTPTTTPTPSTASTTTSTAPSSPTSALAPLALAVLNQHASYLLSLLICIPHTPSVFSLLFSQTMGALVQYALLETVLSARKPSSLTFESAAALPVVGLTALQAMRDCASLPLQYYVVIDSSSNSLAVSAVSRVLRPQGRWVHVELPPSLLALGLWRRLALRPKKLYPAMMANRQGDLEVLGRMVEEGKVRVVVESSVAFEEAREAWRRSMGGYVTGKVVVRRME